MATHITGPTVTLVPYRARHVPRYHGWMEDAELREATASERLSLAEEEAMQRSWQEDPDKLTFLVRANARGAGDGALVGDVNLFLSRHDGGEESSTAEDVLQGECEIMVAERSARRKGVAREAMVLMLAYAVPRLGLRRVMAKVGLGNAASLAMFAAEPLALAEESRDDYFNEATLARAVDDGWLARLSAAFPHSVDENAASDDDESA